MAPSANATLGTWIIIFAVGYLSLGIRNARQFNMNNGYTVSNTKHKITATAYQAKSQKQKKHILN